MMGDWSWMGMAGGWGWVFFLLVIVGIAAIVVLVVRLMGAGFEGGPRAARQRAQALLDERYAKGEIDSEEYEERRGRLRGDR